MSRDAAPTGTIETPVLLDHLLTESSRTFALTIPLLPEPTRCEVTVAYLLFRVADTLEDSNRWPRERKLAELADLAEFLRSPTPGRARELARRWAETPPVEHDGYLELLERLPEVMEVVGRLDPAARESITLHTLRTIEGMASFVAREREGVLRLTDLQDLKDYCYAVAGIVGEMLTELFLLNRENLDEVAESLRKDATSFGEALQLVNILKDTDGDRREGRNFLPDGVERTEVFALARLDLECAGRYCSTLERADAPRGLVAFTALPTMLAAATLERVEEQGAGSKLTRPEVGEIVERLETALDRRRVGALWNEPGPQVAATAAGEVKRENR